MSFQKPLDLRAWSAARAAVLLILLSTTGYAGATGGLGVAGVKISPGSLNFGGNAVGAKSAAKTVTVTNNSRENIEIERVSLSSLQFAYSGPALPLTLGPGQSFSGSVLFLPTAAQAYSARLIFQTNRLLFALTTVNLSGTGTAASRSSTPAAAPAVNATPTITWTAPTAISYGTALSATQLDASANTAGSLAYTPAPGTVLAAGSHTLLVTFTPSDTTDYSTATGSVVLTVSKVTPAISWAAPRAVSYGTALSATQLDATASAAGSFAYSSALGTVLAAGSHTLSVTFTPSDTTDYSTATGSVALTVNKVTPAISWATPTAINYGAALSATQLDATANAAGSFAYSSALGTVLTAGSHTLSVTFTPSDTTDYNTATGSVVLTVNKATPTITWIAPAAITSGTALSATQLDASASTAGSFAYTPALGTVLTAGSQTLSATFTPSDTTDYNTATDSVVLTVNSVNKMTPAITWGAPTAISYGTALSATQLDASANTAGSFVYSPALGTVLSAGSKTLSVTFTPTDTSDYNTATGSVVLTVSKVTPAISWAAPTAVSYGTALSATQLDATASAAGSFAYSSALGTVLAAGSHTLSVTFTPSDTTDYSTATGSVALTVNKVTPAISWATPTAINYGAALSATQLDATANAAGSFAYSSALGTVLTAGSHTLSVTFTPSDTTDYNTATGSVVLTVNKATPTITWIAPAAITSGTALSATQLDATANTAGSFAYTPALGTVLIAGSQTLSVTFTPSDTTDYTTATDSVVVTVNSAAPAIGTLTVNPTSVTFGNVSVGANSSQTVTLKNSGNGSVTISNVSISAPGVSVSGLPVGMVLTGGQSTSLGLTFAASSTGSVTGGVTIASNASNSSLMIPLSASGVSNAVSLTWSVDSSATGGYNVYSSTTSGGPYDLLTSAPVTTPAYTDGTVQAGFTYYYVVTAVDAATNAQSGYSTQVSVAIP